MASDKNGPCWSTLIGTAAVILSIVGALLNQWIAPKEEAVRSKLALIEKDISRAWSDLKNLEEKLKKHEEEDKENLKKISDSIDKNRTESEKRDEATKKVMHDIQVILATLSTSTEYIKETLKELKHKMNNEED